MPGATGPTSDTLNPPLILEATVLAVDPRAFTVTVRLSAGGDTTFRDVQVLSPLSTRTSEGNPHGVLFLPQVGDRVLYLRPGYGIHTGYVLAAYHPRVAGQGRGGGGAAGVSPGDIHFSVPEGPYLRLRAGSGAEVGDGEMCQTHYDGYTGTVQTTATHLETHTPGVTATVHTLDAAESPEGRYGTEARLEVREHAEAQAPAVVLSAGTPWEGVAGRVAELVVGEEALRVEAYLGGDLRITSAAEVSSRSESLTVDVGMAGLQVRADADGSLRVASPAKVRVGGAADATAEGSAAPGMEALAKRVSVYTLARALADLIQPLQALGVPVTPAMAEVSAAATAIGAGQEHDWLTKTLEGR